MKYMFVAAFILILGTFDAGTVLAQVPDYMLDPRLPIPKEGTVMADPSLFLPDEARKDYQNLKTLSPQQKQKMAHALGLLLKAKIITEESNDSTKIREAVIAARKEIFDTADILPEISWLRKILRVSAQALFDAWSLTAKSYGSPVLSASQREKLIRIYGLEDIHPDHHQKRIIRIATKFILDAVTALSGAQIVSPRWSEL